MSHILKQILKVLFTLAMLLTLMIIGVYTVGVIEYMVVTADNLPMLIDQFNYRIAAFFIVTIVACALLIFLLRSMWRD